MGVHLMYGCASHIWLCNVSKLLAAINSQMKAPFHWPREIKPYSQKELRKGIQHGIMHKLLSANKTEIKPITS
jgi:hypothetical protein